ncbi:MAG: hypothetical protein Q9222_003222 [Ikaeria aurantiellina]
MASAPIGSPEIEILEAGTGHGALTLHLARAIHAANAGQTLPLSYRNHALSTILGRLASIFPFARFGQDSRRDGSRTEDGQSVTEARFSDCRAIIHTVEASRKYSEHATKVINGFRKGMYTRDIRFYVNGVFEWVDMQMRARGLAPFLSYALLDLPSSHTCVEKVASALRVDGKLVLFNPSVTQINSAVELVKTKRLPLQLDKVVEVGPSMTGGRIWNVRHVKPRSSTRENDDEAVAPTQAEGGQVSGTGDHIGHATIEDEDAASDDQGWRLICRPQVGDRTKGGGFVALWSKNRTR